MKLYYKTTLTLVVLSEDYPVGQGPYDGMSLEDLAYQTNEGDLVGQHSISKQERITPKDMAEALYELGSEPGFFNLDDAGNEVL